METLYNCARIFYIEREGGPRLGGFRRVWGACLLTLTLLAREKALGDMTALMISIFVSRSWLLALGCQDLMGLANRAGGSTAEACGLPAGVSLIEA